MLLNISLFSEKKEKYIKSKKEMQRTANIYFVTVYKWRATSVIYNFHSNAH